MSETKTVVAFEDRESLQKLHKAQLDEVNEKLKVRDFEIENLK